MHVNKSRKPQILELLRKNHAWISGESISAALGISRVAVGKHIAALRAEGYLIEAASRRGYLLKMEPDTLDISQIRQALKTRIIGRGEWHFFEKTASTNNDAASLGAAGAAEGSLVLAGLQTKGRGRKGREWFSSPRSLAFSVLLRPALPSRKLSTLSLLACLAVHKTIEELTGEETLIKWPNDVLLNAKKTAAVLVEANIVGGEVHWAVLGIGCNLNSVREEFPEKLREKITSLFEETHKIFSRGLVYQKIISELDFYYDLLLKNGSAPLVAKWKEKTDIIGEKLLLSANGQVISGVVKDMNEDGLLIVVDDFGKEHQIEVGDYSVNQA